jgi:hypothetical protein
MADQPKTGPTPDTQKAAQQPIKTTPEAKPAVAAMPPVEPKKS